jgi:hypothetical protein
MGIFKKFNHSIILVHSLFPSHPMVWENAYQALLFPPAALLTPCQQWRIARPRRTRLRSLCKVPTPCGPCKQGIQASLHPSWRNQYRCKTGRYPRSATTIGKSYFGCCATICPTMAWGFSHIEKTRTSKKITWGTSLWKKLIAIGGYVNNVYHVFITIPCLFRLSTISIS